MAFEASSIRIALRIRPLNNREREEPGQENWLQLLPNFDNIVQIPDQRTFAYDFVFPNDASQQLLYDNSVKPLVDSFIEGYNATIFAYGQTGSGKTYTMGTSWNDDMPEEEKGVIPRSIMDIFDKLMELQSDKIRFDLKVSFIEIHNEELLDLLNSNPGEKQSLTIREDKQRGIYCSGVREISVEDPEHLHGLLAHGCQFRTTASTNMNEESSRSHAIFTLHLKQERWVSDSNFESDLGPEEGRWQKILSKFHFVDLAGSERIKKTLAVGDRAKEGASINYSLLVLGNVVKALSNLPLNHRKSHHVPYRESKLTRILQDSLGGNSLTLMIACVSPSASHYSETVNTLKYANRARAIKNMTAINEEFNSETEYLRAQIYNLKNELKLLRRRRMPSIDQEGDDFSPIEEDETFQDKYEQLVLSQCDLESKYIESCRKISILEDQKRDLENRLVKTTAKLVETEENLNTSPVDQNGGMDKAIKHYEFKITILEAELESTNEKLMEAESRLDELFPRLREAEFQISEYKNLMTEEKTKYQLYHQQFDQQMSSMEEKVSQYEDRVSSGEVALKQISLEKDTLQKNEKQREEYITELELKLQNIQTEVQVHRQLKKVKKDLDSESKDMAYISELESLNNEYKERIQILEDEKQEYCRRRRESAELNTEIMKILAPPSPPLQNQPQKEDQDVDVLSKVPSVIVDKRLLARKLNHFQGIVRQLSLCRRNDQRSELKSSHRSFVLERKALRAKKALLKHVYLDISDLNKDLSLVGTTIHSGFGRKPFYLEMKHSFKEEFSAFSTMPRCPTRPLMCDAELQYEVPLNMFTSAGIQVQSETSSVGVQSCIVKSHEIGMQYEPSGIEIETQTLVANELVDLEVQTELEMKDTGVQYDTVFEHQETQTFQLQQAEKILQTDDILPPPCCNAEIQVSEPPKNVSSIGIQILQEMTTTGTQGVIMDMMDAEVQFEGSLMSEAGTQVQQEQFSVGSQATFDCQELFTQTEPEITPLLMDTSAQYEMDPSTILLNSFAIQVQPQTISTECQIELVGFPQKQESKQTQSNLPLNETSIQTDPVECISPALYKILKAKNMKPTSLSTDDKVKLQSSLAIMKSNLSEIMEAIRNLAMQESFRQLKHYFFSQYSLEDMELGISSLLEQMDTLANSQLGVDEDLDMNNAVNLLEIMTFFLEKLGLVASSQEPNGHEEELLALRDLLERFNHVLLYNEKETTTEKIQHISDYVSDLEMKQVSFEEQLKTSETTAFEISKLVKQIKENVNKRSTLQPEKRSFASQHSRGLSLPTINEGQDDILHQRLPPSRLGQPGPPPNAPLPSIPPLPQSETPEIQSTLSSGNGFPYMEENLVNTPVDEFSFLDGSVNQKVNTDAMESLPPKFRNSLHIDIKSNNVTSYPPEITSAPATSSTDHVFSETNTEGNKRFSIQNLLAGEKSLKLLSFSRNKKSTKG